MVYTCFCALCCGPLEPRSIKIAQRAGQSSASASENDDNDGDHSEYSEHSEHSEDEDSEYDATSKYDPRLVSRKSLKWITATRCLGFNPDAEGFAKGFMTGRCGTFFGDTEVKVKPSNDPNQPDDEYFNCYTNWSNTYPTVFPFHDACFEILTRVLTGSSDASSVDKTVLYEEMEKLDTGHEGIGICLELDYGGMVDTFMGAEQYWESYRGQEYSVTQPLWLPVVFEQALLRTLTEHHRTLPQRLASYNSDLRYDADNPFNCLPYEILEQIGLNLPVESLSGFALASRCCLDVVRSNSFWQQFIKWNMPWVWELDSFLRSTQAQTQTLNWRALGLWLQEKSTAKQGIEKQFLGIVNRRRIWRACEQLAVLYFRNIQRTSKPKQGNAIEVPAECFHMPYLFFPTSEEPLKAERQLWVHDWDEMDYKTKIFDAFWNKQGALVGLSVTVGTSQRLLGMSRAQNMELEQTTSRINAGDWIGSLTLYANEAGMAICGISFISTRGKEDSLGEVEGAKNRRSIYPTKEGTLVGVAAEMTSDDVIIRLGILECPYRGEPDSISSQPTEDAPPCQEGFWSHRVNKMRNLIEPEMRMSPLSTSTAFMGQPIGDLSPREVLIWAGDVDESAVLQAISFYAPEISDGHVTIPRVLQGIRVTFARGHYERKRYVGYYRTNRRGIPKDWSEEDLINFKVDGPGGERICKVAVSTATKPGAIRLTTNRGRQVTAGTAEDRKEWQIYNAERGTLISGLCIAFVPRAKLSIEGSIACLQVLSRNLE